MDLNIKHGITKARTDAGLTTLELTFESGVISSTLTKYDQGHSSPKLATLQRIAAACNISTSTLIRYMEEEVKP